MERHCRSAARDRRRPDPWRFGVLILSRKQGEGIVIPSHRIEVVVTEIVGDKVRIGIRAPDEVDIYRDEIWQQIAFDQWTKGDE
jgi:carbon storage regulator